MNCTYWFKKYSNYIEWPYIFIDIEKFVEFHKFHTKNISFLVIPLMIIEVVISIIICYFYFSILSLINLSLVALIWIITFLLQVPSHNKLSTGKSIAEIEKLVSGNVFRVYLWFFKAIVSTLIIL